MALLRQSINYSEDEEKLKINESPTTKEDKFQKAL